MEVHQIRLHLPLRLPLTRIMARSLFLVWQHHHLRPMERLLRGTSYQMVTRMVGHSLSLNTSDADHRQVQLNFKESPFYSIATTLSSVHTLKGKVFDVKHLAGLTYATVVEAGRATHEFNCKLPSEWAARFDRDAPDKELYKILLFGAGDPASSFMRLDVAFPPQFEVKINGVEVRSNWKGLKNKAGTTRPADVTEYLRKTNSYDNTVTITWALTTKVCLLLATDDQD